LTVPNNKSAIGSPARHQSQINKMSLELLVKQAPIACITGLVLAVLMFALLWPVMQHQLLGFWLFCACVSAISRLAIIKYISKHQIVESDLSKPKHYLFINNITASLHGVIWGSLGLFLSPDWPLSHQVVIPMVLAGLCSGGISTYLSDIKSYYYFVFPLVLPLCFGFYSANLYMAALAVIVYLLAMVSLIKRLNYRIIEGFQLRLKNSDLVEHLTDINQQQSSLLKIVKDNELFLQHAFDDAGVPMILVNKKLDIINTNKASALMSGYTKSELLSMSAIDLFHDEDLKEASSYYKELLEGKIDRYQIKKRFTNKEGNTLWVSATISAVRNEQQEFNYAVVQAQDITHEYTLTQHLTYQAKHDALTGLPNRYVLDEKLQQAIADYDESQPPHVLCYLDLDQFKVINDTCGHMAGDELLTQLSKLLKKSVRQSDLLARIGGDEFAILMLNCPLDMAKQSLNDLIQKVSEFRFTSHGRTFGIGASLGLTMIDHQGLSSSDVMKQADSACYIAKEEGRNRMHVYDHNDKLLQQRHGEMQWVSQIQEAIEKHQFVLYAQTITPLDSSLPMHFEILVRLVNDDGTIVPPGKFLPAAERYNLSPAIDLWVIEKVIAQLKESREQGKKLTGQYNINLSGVSIGSPHFNQKLIELIRDNAELGPYLCFEITETSAIANISNAQWLMQELRTFNCQFALDDFGSGLSSFSYLKQLPIDYLKVDGVFVKDCLTDPVNLAMLQSFHDISKVMGIKTVAEYVETEAIYKKLQQLGIDYAQGYWVGEPTLWEMDK